MAFVKKQIYVPALANVAAPARERPRSALEAVMVARWLACLNNPPDTVPPSGFLYHSAGGHGRGGVTVHVQAIP